MNIQEVRQKYPQYSDLSDKELADALHAKFYSDMPAEEFYSKVGIGQTQTPQTPPSRTQDVLSGVNRGIANTVGFFTGDLANNLANLGRMTLGNMAVAVGRPDWAPAPVSAENAPLTGPHIQRLMTRMGMIQEPTDPTGQFIQRIGQDVGAAATMGPSPAMLLSGVASGTGAAVAQQLFPDSPAAELVGQMTPTGLRLGGQAAARGILRGREPVAEAITAAEGAGTTLTTSQATGLRRTQGFERYLSTVPGSAGVMAEKASRQQEEIGGSVKQIIGGIGKSREASQSGRVLQKEAKDFVPKFKSTWKHLDEMLSQHFKPNDRVPLTNTLSKIEELTGKVVDAPTVNKVIANNKLSEINSAILKDAQDGSLSYRSVRELRSVVGQRSASPNLKDDITTGEYKALYGALSEDIKLAAKDDKALRAWERQNRYYHSGMDRVESLSKITSKDAPEQAFTAALQGAKEGPTMLWSLRRSMPVEKWREVVSTQVKRMGRAKPGKQDELEETFSTETFLTNWNSLDRKARAALFDGPGMGNIRNDLDKIAETSARIRKAQAAFANPSGTAQAQMRGITAGGTAAAAILTGEPVTALTMAGLFMGANYMSAKLIQSPKFVKWLADSTKIKPEHIPSYLSRLQATFNNDPEMKKEVEKYIEGVSNGNQIQQ